jgi:hypothetical protein
MSRFWWPMEHFKKSRDLSVFRKITDKKFVQVMFCQLTYGWDMRLVRIGKQNLPGTSFFYIFLYKFVLLKKSLVTAHLVLESPTPPVLHEYAVQSVQYLHTTFVLNGNSVQEKNVHEYNKYCNYLHAYLSYSWHSSAVYCALCALGTAPAV